MSHLAYFAKLNEVFDRVLVHSVAIVPRAELLHWAGQSKVTKRLWRDISAAWEQRCVEDYEYKPKNIPPLKRAWNADTANYILIWGGDYDDEGGFKPYFVNVSELEDEE